MNAILKLVQGTPEWHQHRSQYRNASETPAVLGLSPWQTPYDLWLVKTGRKTTVENEAMKHGTAMEPYARAAYEQETGLVMQPKVVVDGLYSASLDGINMDGKLVLEIKCPFQRQSSKLWQVVKSGKVPDHYHYQVQHQLMVSGAVAAHLWVFDGTVGLINHIEGDEVCQQRIKNAWDEFSIFIDTDTSPPLSELDTELRDDDAWILAAQLYREAKVNSEAVAKKLEEAKERLTSLASEHPSIKGGGVTVSRFWKAGNIDYKNVPEIAGADLEQYRGEGSWVVKVSVDRQAKPF